MKINPTMKMDVKGENDMPFKAIQAVIIKAEDVDTKYDKKLKLVLENATEELLFEVFVNNFSMQNLCEAFGQEDEKWVGKLVDLKEEVDKKYNKKMIVIHALE